MSESTTATVIALAHLAVGVAAVTVLLALHDLDANTGAALLGGLLGVGIGGSLVAVLPTSARTTGTGSTVPATAPAGGTAVPAAQPVTATVAETPAQITGTGAVPAMATP